MSDLDKRRFQAKLLGPDDLDAIEKALDDIEHFRDIEVAPVEPVEPKVAERIDLPSTPDEGADVGDAEFEALSTLYEALTKEGRAWFTSILWQAQEASVSFHGHKSTGRRTVRRFEIYRGLLTLAGWTSDDQETRRAS